MTDVFVAGLSRRDIEGVSLAWRDAFGVGSQWAPDLIDILERKLPLMWPDFSLVQLPDDEMVGIEGYTAFAPPMIAFPDSGYLALVAGGSRARWTAAHELGHLLLHEATTKHRETEATPNLIIDRAYNSAEWQANRFASEFLMPEHVVSEFASPEELARNCQVSLQAARIRYEEIRPEPKKKLPDLVQRYLEEHKTR